jgi:hypothetical protein
MLNFKKSAALSALALTIAACSVTSTSGVKAPQEASGGFLGLVKQDEIKVDTGEAFKSVNQVIIGSFKVGFTEDKKDRKKAGRGVGGNATANLTLKGIDTSIEQQITDAAYDDFVAKLKAAGYTIADRNILLNSEDFKNAGGSEKSPHKEEASIFGASSTMTYLNPTALGEKIYWTGESGNSGGFGFGNPMMAASVFADKNKIPVIFVNYIIDFANSDGSGGSFASTSMIEVGQGISVPASAGSLKLFGGQGGTFQSVNGNITLGQPVYSTEPFAEVVQTTTEAEIAGQYALNAITLMMGAGSNQSRAFDVNADPQKFKTVATSVLGDANGKIVGKMKELR